VQSSALIRINSRREMRAVAINAVPAGNDAGRYGLELRRMREIAFGSIDRLQSRMILLGRSRALERVCGFLLELAHRVQVEAEGTVALPMSRYDIADYRLDGRQGAGTSRRWMIERISRWEFSDRWHSLHTVRLVLSVVAFSAAIDGVLAKG
jgi:CRP-like cAMP-binding protein